MKTILTYIAVASALAFGVPGAAQSDDQQAVKETVIAAPLNVALKVRMEGPYTADVPLQVVCYLKYTPEGAQRMSGAPVELDKHLGGLIASLRARGEFVGDELETLLIIPPPGGIKAKALLLVGLGAESNLSLDTMERVGMVSLREASRLGATKVAFAPLLRDQGNAKLPTGDVEVAVVKGMLLAYDTETRLRKEGFAKSFTLEEWWVEAGAAYYEETVVGIRKAAQVAAAAIAARPSAPHSTQGR